MYMISIHFEQALGFNFLVVGVSCSVVELGRWCLAREVQLYSYGMTLVGSNFIFGGYREPLLRIVGNDILQFRS